MDDKFIVLVLALSNKGWNVVHNGDAFAKIYVKEVSLFDCKMYEHLCIY